MKIALLLMTVLLISCGKNQGGGSSTSGSPQQREGELYLDTKDVGPSELMNATLSERAQISGDTISFSTNRVVQDTSGPHICRLSVENGETWRFTVYGSRLELQLPNGKNLTLSKLYSSGGLFGSWVWKGQENGLRIQKRYTFLPGLVVVNQDCEG